jgi:hypothetical protein
MSSRSLPAFSARTAASPGGHFIAGAMFIASVTATPVNRNSVRSTSVITALEKVAATPLSNACTSRCPDITSPAPACTPARNGGRSRASHSVRLSETTGSSV